METLLALGFWPWALAFAHAFAAAVFFMPRQAGAKTKPPLFFYVWSLGGAAVVAVAAGMVEASNAGLLAGRDSADIAALVALVAGLGAAIGLLPTLAARKLG